MMNEVIYQFRKHYGSTYNDFGRDVKVELLWQNDCRFVLKAVHINFFSSDIQDIIGYSQFEVANFNSFSKLLKRFMKIFSEFQNDVRNFNSDFPQKYNVANAAVDKMPDMVIALSEFYKKRKEIND